MILVNIKVINLMYILMKKIDNFLKMRGKLIYFLNIFKSTVIEFVKVQKLINTNMEKKYV